MKSDKAYVVAHKAGYEPEPWHYVSEDRWTCTDDERGAMRMDLGDARQLVASLESTGRRAAYFVASEFLK